MEWQFLFQSVGLVDVDTLENVLQIIYWILVAVIGICIGSFLNVVIYRLPRGIFFKKSRSFCPTCGHQLKWYDNIPAISWLSLRGKCRYCKTRISPRYIIVELLTMGMWLWTYALFGQYNFPIFILSVIVISAFIALSFIDGEMMIIPDSLIIIIGVCGVVATLGQLICIAVPAWDDTLFQISVPSMQQYVGSVNWIERLIGFGISVILYLIFSLAERIVKKEIIGGGDIKLFFATSLFLGWRLFLLGIFVGAVLALVVEIPAMFLKKDDEEGGGILPFGPYLSIGFTLSLFYGLPLIGLYLGLFN